MNLNTESWAVIFDVDGTMVDNASYHEAAWIAFGHRHGLPITAAYYRAHIHSRSNYETVKRLYGEDVSGAFARRIADEKEAIYRELYRPHIRENAGLTRLLAELREAHVPCAAVSNAPPENMYFVLDELGIRDHFVVAIALTEAMPGKPAPDMLLAAARALDMPMERCLVIEDSVSGFEAAERAHAPYIVLSAGADPQGLKEARRARAVHADFTTLSVALLESYV